MAMVCVCSPVCWFSVRSRTHPQWQWVTWGSAIAYAVWLVGSLALSRYVSNFGSYNATYGSLGAVIGFLVWMWLSTIIVLVGAEINTEMEHQTAHDTTRDG
jgi:membrane protein